MTTTVIGGAYREICADSRKSRTYGSGVRAAAVLGDAIERLVTVADEKTLNEVHSVLRGIPVARTYRHHRIDFVYDTPISPPRLLVDDSDRFIEIPPVTTGDAVVFGMIEAKPSVVAQRAVVDPQHSLSLDQAADLILADELVIVASLSEVRHMANNSDLDTAIDIITDATGAIAVVVKAGALGALVFRPGAKPEGIPAFVTSNVFPIGSGDVFTAALAAHYFQSDNLASAARSASYRTAGYVTVRHFREIDMKEGAWPTAAPTVRSVQDPPKVYIAASFANPEQRWSGRTIDEGIRDIGGCPIYPLREVGAKVDAQFTATADLKQLATCDSIVVLADVARTGPFFEAGWATSRDIPVVLMNSDSDDDRYTMLKGTGADPASDLATAAYKAVWAGLEHRSASAQGGRLMLLSGGLDSAAVAALEQPTRALFVDYGQAAARAERKAARAVAQHLDLELDELAIDLSSVGAGLLCPGQQIDDAPTEEWFPYRNQHLATIAAGHALKHGLGVVVLGLIAGDGTRHLDGTSTFLNTLDMLIRSQEGGLRAIAPHINTPAHELLIRSRLPQELLERTHSCHARDVACGECPGCVRRAELLAPSIRPQMEEPAADQLPT